jgi:adenine-specific DNA methylase
LLDDNTTANDVEVYEPGENHQLGSDGLDEDDLVEAVADVDVEDPESLWDFYPKDVRIRNKKILDPFVGGGTTLVEASRFGVDSVGVDLNPVAWFVTKKQLDAGQADIGKLERAFEQVKEDVADEIKQYYKTPCPNSDHDADVMYDFWVKELDCVSCGYTVPLFKDYRVAAGRYGNNKGKYYVLCPDCEGITLVDNWQKESQCNKCSHEFLPKSGNVTRGGYYNCPECGQKEAIVDAISTQGKPNQRLFAIEYYCGTCDNQGREKSEYKSYKQIDAKDKKQFAEAEREWQTRTDLHEYVPHEKIPEGAITAASSVSGNDVFQHGLETWTEMFNERQLLSLSKLLKSIDEIDGEAKEYLLIAFSESLNYNTIMTSYNPGKNLIANLFNKNSFVSPQRPVENNPWGVKFGTGTFSAMWDMVKKGVEYAKAPTERYIENGEKKETPKFAKPIGEGAEVYQDDMRNITSQDEYDAIITDPPYYDNIIYSEVSDYFYVWQKILLEHKYPGFDRDKTPRTESIVKNPYLGKTTEDFEHEMGEALDVINRALKDDGTLAFTYHHADEESWGELLESLCDNNFEVTATYPINSDLTKFNKGEAVSFDIVIIARPTENRTPISWRQLRINILNKLDEIQESVKEHRDLTEGDIGVVEMGACFAEYSKHHGEVRRSGEIMTAKEAVDEIYGIIQEGTLGEQDIFHNLQRMSRPGYDDLKKLLKKSDASEEELREKRLFRMDGDEFILGDWRDQKRQAYVQNRVDSGDGDPTLLDKAHYLRYRYEEGRSTKEHLERWASDDLEELCEGLAEATGDETYLKMIGVDTSLAEFTDQ